MSLPFHPVARAHAVGLRRPLIALAMLVALANGCQSGSTNQVDNGVLDLRHPTTHPARTATTTATTGPATRRVGARANGARSAASRPTTANAAARGPMEHRLVVLDTDALASRGHFDHTARDGSTGIVLREPAVDYPLVGTWTSDTIAADVPFTELLPSWNASVPDRTGTRFDVRVRDAANGTWSPWLYIGYWGRVTTERRTTEFAGGAVDIDTLKLTAPADAFEIRATLQEFNATPTASPGLRKIAAVYSREPTSDIVSADAQPDRAGESPSTRPTTLPARVDIPVPYRAQGDNPKTVSGSTCSPTSTSMILAWAGADRPILENALAIWDDDYSMFGNWNRAVQYAASLGFDAQLERFSTMDQVRARLAEGQPLIASIRFRRGEFPSNVLEQTAGHLIVVRGYTESGDLIVNDPASKGRGNGIVYKADELAHAWLVNTGGASYVIKKKQ